MRILAKCLRATLTAGIAAACVMTWAFGAMADKIYAPGGGAIHALIVGINDYNDTVGALEGSVADANDLYASLIKAGVPKDNITLFLDHGATRANLIAAMKTIVAQSNKGDLAILSFAGHGGRMREMYPNTKKDHIDEAYILAKYDRSVSAGAKEVIAAPEIKHWIKELDGKGADILFIADTCHGGGLTRRPMRMDLSVKYRGGLNLPDSAEPLANEYSSAADAALPQDSFPHLTFLAAADSFTKAPEVQIDGKPRGALSYVAARAIEGKAGSNEGVLTRGALFGYALQQVLHHSNAQVIFTQPRQGLTRAVWRTAAGPVVEEPEPLPAVAPVRVAVENGDAAAVSAAAKRVYPFVTVLDKQSADIVWDASTREAFVRGGDLLAKDVGAADIPGVVDRFQASALLARLSDDRPQTFRLLPGYQLHHKSETERLSLEADNVLGKYLIAFNIAGNGIVQYLFPAPTDRPQVTDEGWRVEGIEVKEPFGSDQVVVVVSPTRLTALEQQLQNYNDTSNAGSIPALLKNYLDPARQVRIGLVTIATAP